jgi:hypothetical protein
MLAVTLVVAVVLATAAAWLLLRRRSDAGAGPAKAPAAKPFAAVEIRTRSSACAAARALQGQRFLSNAAPALPLAGCTAAQCSCTFAKLADRRTDDRRLGGLSAALFLEQNRREDGDRRHGEPERDPTARSRR